MKIRILTETDIRKIIDMNDAIEIQRIAFDLLGKGLVVSGLRSFATSQNPPGIAIFNPAFLKNAKGYGVKIVSDFFKNDDLGIARMSSLVNLFSGETGHPTTIMEGGYLTDLRTGAVTGLAAKFLARNDSKVLTVIGAGRVAKNQIDALSRIFPIKKLLITTRTPIKGKSLGRHLIENNGWKSDQVQLINNADDAVAVADIVVCATTSETPTFSGKSLKPGTFVAAVGANTPSAREVDSETIGQMQRIVIDSREDSLKNAGDLLVPINENLIKKTFITELSALVNGSVPGRETEKQKTYFKSIGLPIQDLVMAQAIE